MSLQVHPELWRVSKVQTQPQTRFIRNASAIVDDLGNAVWRDPDSFGKMVLRESVLGQELVSQHFTGRDGCKLILGHSISSMSLTVPRISFNDSPRSAPRGAHHRATER